MFHQVIKKCKPVIDGVVANIRKSTGTKIACDVSTQLALKHQQLMNMEMELVKRNLSKNFVSLKVKSQGGLKIKKT